jgi:hypothetical protein
MSQQSKNTLQSAINTQIADNTSGNITAANVRNNLINITDSLVFNTGSQAITGSLTVTGGITGSLQGTATTAATASYIAGTIVKTVGYYRTLSDDFNWQTTASNVSLVFPIETFQPYYSIDLAIQTWDGGPYPVVVKLYASTTNTYSQPFIATSNDVLIATYSASIGGSPSKRSVYRLKRSFYHVGYGDESDNTTYYIVGANPTASMLSDELNTEQYETYIGTNAIQYPYLRVAGQTNAGSFYSYTYAFGPLRVTYKV